MIETELFDTLDLEYLAAMQGVHFIKTAHSRHSDHPNCSFCAFVTKLLNKHENAYSRGVKITISDLSNYTNKPNPIKKMKKANDIIVEEAGYKYALPCYEVTNQGIQDTPPYLLQFCRGDKSDETKPRQVGVFVESLLWTTIHRLETVNVGELANDDTQEAIDYIAKAIGCLERRSADRKARGVEQTYQK